MKSVKCIISKTTYNTILHAYSVAEVDYRGAAAPKKTRNTLTPSF